MVEVRSFARHDREQLRELASAHAGAAIPGVSLPTAMLLSQLERPLGEVVVGSWVIDVATFVAVERDRVVAAAHLRRYGDDVRVSDSYRNAGEIVWLLCWPEHLQAGRTVRDAALSQLARWGTSSWHGDGSLPAPGVYGVSDSWPHIQQLYAEAGFDPSDGHIEIVYAGTLSDFPEAGESPMAGVSVERHLGPLGTAFNALLDDEIVGTFEVDTDLTGGGANLAFTGWADECNHWVSDELRGRGIGSWLVAHGSQWMRLAGTTRFLAYAIENDRIDRCTRYYARHGLHQIQQDSPRLATAPNHRPIAAGSVRR